MPKGVQNLMNDDQTPAEEESAGANDRDPISESVSGADSSQKKDEPLPPPSDEVRSFGSNYLTPGEREHRRRTYEAAARWWEYGFRTIRIHWMEGEQCSCGRSGCASAGKHPVDKEW